MKTIQIFCISVLCLIIVVTSSAQTAGTGAVTGTASDANGAAVAGAQVKVTNERTGEERTVVTSENGGYTVPLLSPGFYRIEFTAKGFKKSVKTGLQVNVTETARFDVRFEVGSVNEQVNVTADASVLQTESSALGRVADSTVVSNLPLVTRNFTQIATLSPGVSAPVTRGDELGRGSGGLTGGAFRSHGAFGADNNFMLNGVQANDLQSSGNFSGGIPIPNPDAIQEFKVLTGQYDATYGRNAGANVNVVTKGGGNQFRGSLFEFFRNEKLNANDFFRNRTGQPRGVLRQNQFGGTLGGPIVKDRVSFFGSYQGTRQINGIAGGAAANISTPAFTNDRSRAALGALFAGQAGAFGGLAIAADGSNISNQALALLNLKLPNGQYVIPTPQTVNNALSFAARGFSAFSVPGTFNENQFMTNMDILHTAKSRITGRFYFANSDLVQPLPPSQLGTSFPGFPYFIPNKFRNLTIGHVYTFNSNLLNQFDFGYNGTTVGSLQQEVFKYSDIGVNAPPVENQFPVIGVASSGSTGGNGQSLTLEQRHYNFQDSLTYIRGRQTFRFGGGITRSRVHLKNFTFFGGIQFQSWADLLLGRDGGPVASGGNGSTVSNLTVTIDVPGDLDRDWKVWDGNAYVQDDIKLTSSLMLNVGVRYERLGHLADIGGRNASFDISLADPNATATGSLAGFMVSSNFNGTLPAGVKKLDNEFGILGVGQNNIDPRIGFAWKLPGSRFTNHMVLRGGYGIYHTRATGQAFLQLATGQPFASLRQVVLSPTATFANPFAPLPALPTFVPYTSSSSLTINLVDPHYRPPFTHEYSLNLQTDLTHGFLLETGYVGTLGRHLISPHQLNQAALASPSAPIRGVTTNLGSAANVRLRVPILGFSPIGLIDIDSVAVSRYDSLEVSLTKRLSRGLQFLASYTFAHAYSDAGTNTGASGTGPVPGNQVDRHANYGRADFNREHRFIFSYVYNFPTMKAGNRFVSGLLGGWSISGVTTIQSGTPLTITGTNAQNAYGIASDRAQFAVGCDASGLLTTGSVISRLGGASLGPGYFNNACINRSGTGAAAWIPVEAGGGTAFGNSGVGIVTGPGQNSSDIAIVKRTRLHFLTEGSNLEFRTEFFNVFNTPQFSNPGTSVSSAATFGVISSTSVNPRIIQFALKLNF